MACTVLLRGLRVPTRRGAAHSPGSTRRRVCSNAANVHGTIPRRGRTRDVPAGDFEQPVPHELTVGVANDVEPPRAPLVQPSGERAGVAPIGPGELHRRLPVRRDSVESTWPSRPITRLPSSSPHTGRPTPVVLADALSITRDVRPGRSPLLAPPCRTSRGPSRPYGRSGDPASSTTRESRLTRSRPAPRGTARTGAPGLPTVTGSLVVRRDRPRSSPVMAAS